MNQLKAYFLQQMKLVRSHQEELRTASNAALESERSRTSQLEARAQESELAIQNHYQTAIQTEHGRLISFEQAVHNQEIEPQGPRGRTDAAVAMDTRTFSFRSGIRRSHGIPSSETVSG